MYYASAVWTPKSSPNLHKMPPKGARGYPLEGPERPKTAQEHPRAPQEIPRDDQKASQKASGSPLEALWERLERFRGVLADLLKGDFEIRFRIDSGNADFLKSMLSLTREHRFWSPEGPKMEPKSLPKRYCEAKRAKEERQSA